MASIKDISKPELLVVLESVPQHFWPPRPTRQAKATLVEAIEHAHYLPANKGGDRVRSALAAAWNRKRVAS